MTPSKCFVLLLFLVTTLIVEHANTANILVVVFFSTKSHKLTYIPLVEELGKRGHNITMLSPVKPMKEMKNVKEIFTLDVEKIFAANDFDAFDAKEKGKTVEPAKMMEMIYQTCDQTYDLPVVKDLVGEKFDLIILQPFMNDCALGLVYRLKAPFLLFTPTSVPSMIVSSVGGSFPTSITPHPLLGYSVPMTFKERFINFGVENLINIAKSLIFVPKFEKLYREKRGNDIPSASEILANASLVLSNGHFSLTAPKPYYPDVIDVGGIHSRPAKPVPKDLEDFISRGGKDGFILFSMGSAIKGDMMPDAKRKLILNVFSRLKQQVLWKWESETMPDLPKNVKLSKWLPQQDLLGHKDIKMFITHCGGGSTEEAIYHGVPMIGIPMFADQHFNSGLAKDKGFLVELDWNILTEENFEGAIREILDDPKYQDNVNRLSALFSDRPQDPLDLGVYWVEYVLRHNGAPHLRSVGRNLNFLVYHSIDVISTYLALIVAFGYLIYFVLRLVCTKLFCRGQSQPGLLAKVKKTN